LANSYYKEGGEKVKTSHKAAPFPKAFKEIEEEPMDPEDLARLFHETYEELAPQFGYTTRISSKVPWTNVPEPNKSLMIATAKSVLEQLEPQIEWKNVEILWPKKTGNQ
jgi:hypothetical protein